MDSSFGNLDADFLMHLYTNKSMVSPLVKDPRPTMDPSIAHLDTELVNSAPAEPKSRARAQPTVTAGPSTGGFCMAPERGLGRRTQTQRYLVGFAACMVDMPDMTIQETFDVNVPNDQNPSSALAKVVDFILDELEAQLQIKEKECTELRELVESCSRVLPRRIMVGRKAASISISLERTVLACDIEFLVRLLLASSIHIWSIWCLTNRLCKNQSIT